MANTGLLSLGIFLILVAVSVVFHSVNIISVWEIPPLIIGLYGCWIICLAGIRRRETSKYERGALSTFAWGLLLTVTGFSLILRLRNILQLLHVFAAVLLVIGILAVAVATERK